MVIAVKSNPVRYMMQKSDASDTESKKKCDSSEDAGTQLNAGSQEFVGNCKEFRIDNNKSHLKIIGNCNKIRLTNNNGHLEVIGNSTCVKIAKNNGQISYTGNSGKVYLGRESSNKNVDYIGNSGVLKVVPEENLNIGPKKTNNNNNSSEGCEKIPLGNEKTFPNTESGRSPVSSVKIQTGQSTSTEIHFDNIGGMRLQLNTNSNNNNKNINFSTQNINCSSSAGGSVVNSVQIISTSGNIIVNSSYKV